MRVALAVSTLSTATATSVDRTLFRRRRLARTPSSTSPRGVLQACDPDVGILAAACSDCVPDETSWLGGSCVDHSSQRALQLSNYCSENYCDCSGLDPSTDTGIVVCDYGWLCTDLNGAPACVRTLVTATSDASGMVYQLCYELHAMTTRFPYQSICYTSGTDETGAICRLVVDAVECASTECSNTNCPNPETQAEIGLDCTNTNRGDAVDLCSDAKIMPIVSSILDSNNTYLADSMPTATPVLAPTATEPSSATSWGAMTLLLSVAVIAWTLV